MPQISRETDDDDVDPFSGTRVSVSLVNTHSTVIVLPHRSECAHRAMCVLAGGEGDYTALNICTEKKISLRRNVVLTEGEDARFAFDPR